MRLCSNICPRLQVAVEILGRRWVHLIVQVLTERPHRFGELASRLEALSERMLSERLKELVAEGIVERRVIPETPVQVEYHLTPKGEALRGVLEEVAHWAERWVEVPAGTKESAAPEPERPRAKPGRKGDGGAGAVSSKAKRVAR